MLTFKIAFQNLSVAVNRYHFDRKLAGQTDNDDPKIAG